MDYQAGKLFAEVFKRTGGKTDEASIVSAFWKSMKDYDTGLMAPLTFSSDRHAGALAGAIMKAEGGKWKIITGWLAAN